MSDTAKPMVTWAPPSKLRRIARALPDTMTTRVRNTGVFSDDRPHLLLPIEDGALRVGDHLFRRETDPGTSWYEADPRDLYDLLMDAVEGVEP